MDGGEDYGTDRCVMMEWRAGRHEETQKERDKLIGSFAGTGKELRSAGHRHGEAGDTGGRHSWSPKARSGAEQAIRFRLIQKGGPSSR